MTNVRSKLIALTAAALLAVCPRICASQPSLQGGDAGRLSSPDGTITVTFIAEQGNLGYTVKKNGRLVYTMSNLSLSLGKEVVYVYTHTVVGSLRRCFFAVGTIFFIPKHNEVLALTTAAEEPFAVRAKHVK